MFDILLLIHCVGKGHKTHFLSCLCGWEFLLTCVTLWNRLLKKKKFAKVFSGYNLHTHFFNPNFPRFSENLSAYVVLP